jgi:RNA polymerase sigma factor (TIGR02999 family)
MGNKQQECPMSSDSGELTSLLARARDGDHAAASEVFTRLHGELRKIANRLFAGERQGNTLQPTAIVNEAWLKLMGRDGQLDVPDLNSRTQFCAVAARAMRQILVDHARGRAAAKRGGGQVKMSVDECDPVASPEQPEFVAIHEALERLEAIRPRAARVVELRYFGGSTIPETAVALGISPETVKNDWRFAKAWLKRELQDDA